MKIILDQFYYDALNEIGNIGMGNATTALSQLVGKAIRVSASELTSLEPEYISRHPDNSKSAAIVKIIGDLNGGFILMLNRRHSETLSEMLLARTEYENDSYMKNSVSIEVANILAGTYCTALSRFLDISVTPSLPILAEGSPDDVLNKCGKYLNGKMDHIMGLTALFEIEAEDEYHSLSGDIYMLLDTASMRVIIDRINQMRT
ncbi:MAG: chemotaxis protein CheC [Methanolobus sp.]|nr:chemotaxis protein CheC [Methanolobus sp.]